MNRLSGLTLGRKIALALALLLVIAGAGVGFAYNLASRATDAVEQSRQNLDEIAAASAVQRAWSQAAATLDYLLLTRQPALVAQDLARETADFVSAGEQMQAVFRKGSTGEARLAEMEGSTAELAALGEQVVDLAVEEQWEPAQLLRYGALASAEERFQQRLTALAAGSEASAMAAAAEASRLHGRVQTTALTSAALMILLASAGGYLLTRSIVGPVRGLTAAAESFAQGNFDASITPAPGELGRLGEALKATAVALQEEYSGLEQRIAGRARALETSIEVGRRLATIHDVEALVAAVVHQVQVAFGYYHVHIYLLDENHEKLVLAGGTGDAGRTMLAQGHRLEVGQGLVGLAARLSEPVLAPDTHANSDWLPNPLLPQTSAEIAVPIRYGNQVLGVLDVQHDVPGSLGKDDVALLEAVAGQVAVALQNARLLQEADERSRQAALANVIGQRIQRAGSVEEVLRLAVKELGQALGSERARVQLRAAPTITTSAVPGATAEKGAKP